MKKKLYVVYHYFAHYRHPVVTSILNHQSEIDVFFVADEISNEPALLTMDFSKIDNFSKVENIWFGKWLWQNNLFKLLRKSSPDYIIFLGQFSFISTWFCALYFRMLGKKIFFWGHGAYGNEKGLKKLIRKVFNLIPHKHLVYGHYAKDILVSHGIDADDVVVIYNSLDYRANKTILNDLQTNPSSKGDIKKRLFTDFHERPLGIFVGRLTPIKNLDMIIHCIKILNARGCYLNFLFVGDGPTRSALEDLVKKEKLDSQIKFYGSCHDETIIGGLIYSSDLCISPGNVGLTAMHALSYGTPVITHNNFPLQMPEFEAIIPGVNGDFFEFNNVDSLVSVVEKWIDYSSKAEFDIYQNSIDVIDKLYNPDKQAELIFSAID